MRAFRALDRAPSQSWVDWAVRLLVEGTDTPALRLLAGRSAPFDYGDVTALVDRALAELDIPHLDKDAAVEAYATELVQSLLRDGVVIEAALAELFDLCVETNYSRALYNFYQLRCARDDLRDHGRQSYWDGANSSNIDDIVRGEARRWLEQHKRERLALLGSCEAEADPRPAHRRGVWPGFEADPLHRVIDWLLGPLRGGR